MTFHVTDSPTSQAAAEHIRPRAAQMRRQVLAYLVAQGLHGATDEEIQDGTGMNPSTERPRRGELEAAGLVEQLGERRPTRSGCQAIVWYATEKGKAAV